ncbi:MAG: hypothetical protein KKG99_15795 [Bacteroidetes bacterium]|nr:hypothetical protein [Bacteroidota bacterium]
MIRYFQLLIFVLYLGHGFIPHHHHDKNFKSSFDISFTHNNLVCSCHSTVSNHNNELDSDCFLCDKLSKEYHYRGYFFKEPVLSINIVFQEAFTIVQSEEIIIEYPILTDFKVLAGINIQTHGLRAPPIA